MHNINKHYAYIIFCFFFNSLLHGNNIKVHKYDTKLVNIGYDNCSMKTNGEQNVIDHLTHPGMTVFDIGANIGEWSLNILKKSNDFKIYAFEPIPEIFNQLRNNLPLEAKSFNIALSSQIGTRKFNYYNKNTTTTQCSSFYQRPIIEKNLQTKPVFIQVATTTLDWFCDQNTIYSIDFLKIDTEGAELNVLQGAEKLLKRNAIKIIQFEYGGTYLDAGITLHEVYNLLTNNNYSIFRIISDSLIAIDSWKENLENFRYSNYLAISNNELNQILQR